MIPRTGTIADVVEALQRKCNLDDETMANVQVYEAHNNKWYKTLNFDHPVLGIGEYLQLYIATFPKDDSEKKISVFHFDKEPSKLHGIPFQFPLKEVSAHMHPCTTLADSHRVKNSATPSNGSRISPKSRESNLIRSNLQPLPNPTSHDLNI